MNKKSKQIKKLKKRLNKRKNNKSALNAKKFEQHMSIKYNCHSEIIEEYLNYYEKKWYNNIINKWIEEDLKKTKLIKKYEGIIGKKFILYNSVLV